MYENYQYQPVNPIATGFLAKASSGDAAIFILFSSTLIQKTFSGKKVVVPTPTKASVDAIAMKSVLTPATEE